MEQLEAFRQKKAKERLDRTERIQKRLEQIRGRSAAVVCSQSAPGHDAVQKSATRAPADGLLKDTTNRVSNSSVAAANRQLSARAKLVAGKLSQSRCDEKTSGGRRLTVTLSAPSEMSEAEAGEKEKCKSDVRSIRECARDENVPHLEDSVSARSHLPYGKNCKPLRGKRLELICCFLYAFCIRLNISLICFFT